MSIITLVAIANVSTLPGYFQALAGLCLDLGALV